MKTYKKLVGAIAFLLIAFFSFSHLAMADTGPFASDAWNGDNVSYGLNKPGEIVATFSTGKPTHDPVTFIDTFPNDGKHHYEVKADNRAVCSGSIDLQGSNPFASKPSIKASITMHIVQYRSNGGTGSTCSQGGDNYPSGAIIPIDNNLAADGTAADTGPRTVTYNGKTYEQIDTLKNKQVYGASTDVDSCYGGSILVLKDVPTKANAPVDGTLLDLAVPPYDSGLNLQDMVTLPAKFPLESSSGICKHQDNGDDAVLNVYADGSTSFKGCPPKETICNGQTKPTASAGSTAQNSCEGSSNTGFEWIFCGVLRIFDKFANTVTGIIENLLNFDTNKYLDTQVKNSWNIMRVIASAVLVIIMLVMVISQALGGSLLDAYTIRKMLPRLVVAVILMQISWYMLIWIIGLANDLGHGVRDLICAPFGGYGQMNLDKLIGQLGWAAPGLTVTAGALFTGIAIAFSGLTIGGAALLGVSAVLSLVVGLVMLLLREIFIILSVILFPFAIIAWILPGTQKYWKIWYDNFTKLMLLFPLIMALIYGGRIFAHVAGGTGDVLAVFIVFVGYFGPYWFLPKTFKWGGQLYASAAGGAWNATKGMRNFPGKYSLARAKDNRQFRAEERARRIGRDPVAASRWDQLLAGRYNVARSQGGRMRQYAHTVGEGQKTAREAVAEELTVSGYQNWGHDQKLDALEKWLRGESYAGINAEGNDELRLFAFKTLADLGDQDRIRRARQQGRLKGSIWLKGRAENISSLNQQASDMGIQADLSTVAPDAMASWKSHTWKEWIRQVQNGVVMDNSDDGGGDLDVQDPNGTGHRDPAKRQQQLSSAQSQANRILNNRLVFDRLSADQQDFVRSMATMEGTQVAVSEGQGVQLPAGDTLANRASVRENLMTHLSQVDQAGRGTGASVANELAPRIVEAARASAAGLPLTSDQQGDLQVFHQVLDRGTAPDSTPEMQRALANLERSINGALAGHEAETERQLTASNSPNLSATLQGERNASNDVRRTLGI